MIKHDLGIFSFGFECTLFGSNNYIVYYLFILYKSLTYPVANEKRNEKILETENETVWEIRNNRTIVDQSNS